MKWKSFRQRIGPNTKKSTAIFSTIGDGKDPLKNAQAVGQLDHSIDEYPNPNTSEAYFMRARLAFSSPSPDYAKILKDIDKTEQLNSSANSKNPTVTTASIYVLRAKVHLLTNDHQQAIADLESATKSDPSKGIFNNGGVKAEEETADRAAMQSRDFEYLISKYPNDFRVYMARLKLSTSALLEAAPRGRIAAQSDEAQNRRSQTQLRHRAASLAWNASHLPAWLSEKVYLTEIQPRLPRITLSVLASKLGISIPYAVDIRSARRVPHPRHWETLAKLVNFSG